MTARARSGERTAIRTAMVLGAGLGKRMLPLTRSRPKPLVELAGRALIDHVLDRLVEAGIERVVINVHYLADQMQEHLGRRRDLEVVISDERELLLDTGGGVAKALPHLGKGPFFIHNVDSISTGEVGRDLRRMAANWHRAEMDSLLLLASVARSVGYAGHGDFLMGQDGRIVRRPERQLAPFAFTGVSIATASLFEDAPSGPFSLNLLWNRAIERGRLMGLRQDGLWMHVGDPHALAEAERCLQQGMLERSGL